MAGEAASAADALVIAALRPKPSRWKGIVRFARQKPLGAIAALVIFLLVLIAILGPLIAPFDPLEMHLRDRLLGPSGRYWFGTDDIGRDVLSRLIYGSRTSLFVGLMAVGMGTTFGTMMGILSGYFEGKVDLIIQRVADTIMSFPGLIFLMTIVAVLGTGLFNAMLAIAVLIWPSESRILRGAVLSAKQNAYVDAARSIGASDLRILLRHILPNVMAPIIIIASVMLGGAILLEASLSFLGLGTPPPRPSWGGMLSAEGRRYMESAPWLAVAPGVTISIVVLAFNLLGDALRDILDPRLRGTQ
ncbi:MAG: ABC transporter permease [Chloroflexi bacterium]|nr:ABC transporter permease [Chloroflexota bacterium]